MFRIIASVLVVMYIPLLVMHRSVEELDNWEINSEIGPPFINVAEQWISGSIAETLYVHALGHPFGGWSRTTLSVFCNSASSEAWYDLLLKLDPQDQKFDLTAIYEKTQKIERADGSTYRAGTLEIRTAQYSIKLLIEMDIDLDYPSIYMPKLPIALAHQMLSGGFTLALQSGNGKVEFAFNPNNSGEAFRNIVDEKSACKG